MKFEITDPVEAMATMEAVQKEAMDYLIASAKPGPVGEYAELRSKVLQRVATRIADTFIPEDPRDVIRREEIELGIY